MPGDKKEPWEELGFETFAAYNESLTKKIDGLVNNAKTMQEQLDKKVTELSDEEKAAKKEADDKAEKEAKLKKEEEDNKGVVTEDQYKIKATTLYASLTDEQRTAAEGVISQLPDDVQAVAKTSFEAKYMILQEMYPEAGDDADDGSVFGDLKSKKAKVSPSDLIKEAMATLRGGGQGNPERHGSGFVLNKKPDGSVATDDGKPAFDMMAGLYKG